jgi:hypothetical protein
MAAFYRRDREHGVMGSAAGARLVSANEGEGLSGLSAEGCGGLQALAGALAGGGVVGSEGDTLGGSGAVFLHAFHVSRPGVGAEGAEDRQRGERGCPRVRLGRLGSTETVSHTVSWIF